MSVTNDANEDRMYRTVSDALGIEYELLREASSPSNLEEWDSLSHLQLVMALESEFELTIPPDDVLNIRDLKSMRTQLRKLGVDV